MGEQKKKEENRREGREGEVGEGTEEARGGEEREKITNWASS